jgi:hypothetical protein
MSMLMSEVVRTNATLLFARMDDSNTLLLGTFVNAAQYTNAECLPIARTESENDVRVDATAEMLALVEERSGIPAVGVDVG